MKKILHISDEVEFNKFKRLKFFEQFDDITMQAIDLIIREYDFVINQEVAVCNQTIHNTNNTTDSLSVAVLTSEVEPFHSCCKYISGVVYIFSPSPLAYLDIYSKERKSLVLACDLEAGDVLTGEHVRSVIGGSGIGVEFLSSLLGRSAVYNLRAGCDLGYGYFE
jgi:hypothetical protein